MTVAGFQVYPIPFLFVEEGHGLYTLHAVQWSLWGHRVRLHFGRQAELKEPQ